MLKIGREAPTHLVRRAADAAQAAADLLQHKALISTFGDRGEWEVRTTLTANRQRWSYHSGVFLQGKERKKGFPPIAVDRTREIRQHGAISEELLAAFAREAAEVHLARCEGIKEYLTLARFFTEPAPRYRRSAKVALGLLSAAVLLGAFWWLKDVPGFRSVSPDQQVSAPHVQWQTPQIAHQLRAGEAFEFSLPGLAHAPEGVPLQISLETSGHQPGWLQLDRERWHMRGTVPLAAAKQTYRFGVRANTAQGSESRLSIVLSIVSPAESSAPVRRLPGHWAW
jgi:hypothetical protein